MPEVSTMVVNPPASPAPATVSTPVAQPIPTIGTDITGVNPSPAGLETPPQPIPASAPSTPAPSTLVAQPVGQQPTSPEPVKVPEAIPYQRFSEVVAEKNNLQQEILGLRDQVRLMTQLANPMAAQPTPAQQPATPPAPQPSIVAKALEKFKDDGYLNREQVGTVLQEVADTMQSDFQSKLSEVMFFVQHPDFSQVCDANPQSPLMQALSTNPALAQTIKYSRNPVMAAYEIGRAFMARNPATSAPASPPAPPPPPNPPVVNVIPTISSIPGIGAIGGKKNWGTMPDSQFQQERAAIVNKPIVI